LRDRDRSEGELETGRDFGRRTEGKKRVSSSVAESFWPCLWSSAASDMWFSSLLQEYLEERERELEERSDPLFVRNWVRGQCLCSRTMYIIYQWDPSIFSKAFVCKAWPELCVVLLSLSRFGLNRIGVKVGRQFGAGEDRWL
jgi:hypothetical protein